MPSRLRKRKSRSPLPPPQNSSREMPRSPVLSPGISTSLDSVQITPRTPRAVRPRYAEVDVSLVGGDVEEVEMSLLSGDERSRAEPGFTNGDGYLEDMHKVPIISLFPCVVLFLVEVMTCPDPVTRHLAWPGIRYDTYSQFSVDSF